MTNLKTTAGLTAGIALAVCGGAESGAMKRRLGAVLGLVLAILINPSSWADVISYGDGDASLDTTTGLLWLDIRQTRNRSYLDVSANFGAGGDFEGYRYANAYEVLTLWQHAGIIGSGTIQGCSGVDCIYAEYVPGGPVSDFVALIGGDTWTPDYGFGGVIGLSSTLSLACTNCGYTAYMTPELRDYTNSSTTPPLGSAEALIVEGLRDYIADPSYGSWLVSTTPIPIPAAAYLFGSGLLGIIGFGRRKALR